MRGCDLGHRRRPQQDGPINLRDVGSPRLGSEASAKLVPGCEAASFRGEAILTKASSDLRRPHPGGSNRTLGPRGAMSHLGGDLQFPSVVERPESGMKPAIRGTRQTHTTCRSVSTLWAHRFGLFRTFIRSSRLSALIDAARCYPAMNLGRPRLLVPRLNRFLSPFHGKEWIVLKKAPLQGKPVAEPRTELCGKIASTVLFVFEWLKKTGPQRGGQI